MTETTSKVLAIIGDVNPTVTIGEQDHNRSLFELGLDSLDYASILLQIEETFEIKISDEEADCLTTMANLVRFVDEHAAKGAVS